MNQWFLNAWMDQWDTPIRNGGATQIVPGATAELTIPLGSFPTRDGGTHLTVTTTGMGPQVISTPTFALDFRAK